jgi:4-hydroxy-3-polyprenylbenzoate decarboxylase
LHEFISFIEKNGELLRISHPVSTDLEISEIVDRVSKSPGGGKAFLFENNGTDFPLLINAFGSEKRMAMALGCQRLDEIGERIEQLFKNLTEPKPDFYSKLKTLPLLSQMASWMPKTINGRGACQQIVIKNPDLSKLPVLKCWPADGGPFITLPCVITRDPNNGMRNVGMYRMQVLDAVTTGMHWHQHKTGARHYQEYKRRGERMPVSVVLGGDPAYTYSATAPLPDNLDEYLLAGFLRNKKVELVKCLTNDLEVPSDADIIIEGYVDPAEELVWEGPFGDHTGFYSLADWYPKFHVTCITHRKDAVYPATIVGIPPQEDAWIGKATERIFLQPMKLSMIPELQDMDLPPSGVAHNLTIVGIRKSWTGQAQKVMNALWGAGQMMFNKILIVTDQEKKIHYYEELTRTISENVDPARDLFFSVGPMDVLDHSSSAFAYGSKMGIDATVKEHSIPNASVNLPLLEQKILQLSGIEKINTDFLKRGISLLIIAIQKRKRGYFKEFIIELLTIEALYPVKFILFTDPGLDIRDAEAVSWYCSGNIDPKRDCMVIEPTYPNENAHLFINGTAKSAEIDEFPREWPNPVVSSTKTIQKIDQLWPQLGIGELIPSPSLKYLSLQKGEGAVAE